MVEVSVCHIHTPEVVTYLVKLPHGSYYIKLNFVQDIVVIIKVIKDVSSEIVNVVDFYNMIKDIDYSEMTLLYPIHIIKECILSWCVAEFREYNLNKLI